MAVQKVISIHSSSSPPASGPQHHRSSAAPSTVSADSSSSSSSGNRNKSRRMSSMMRCFPNRRQRKSTTVIKQPPIILREPIKGSVLGAPIPFSQRETRPTELDCSLFSHQKRKSSTISVPLSPNSSHVDKHSPLSPNPSHIDKYSPLPSSPVVPLCADIFATNLAAQFVSPQALALCAHETLSTNVTASRTPGKSLSAPTPIAGFTLDMHTETREVHTPQGEASSSLNYTPTQTPAPISPLPAYMDPIEDLEIRNNITVQARDDVATFTSLLNDTTGWKDVGSKHGVKVARKDVGHGKPALVKGTVQFKAEGATAEDVISFFWATNPMRYNDTVEASFRLRTWTEDLCVFYQSYKGAMGAQGRDFVLYGTRAAAEDKNRAIFVSKSCEWKRTNAMLAPRVRAQCYIGGMVCTAVSPGVFELTQIWQADLCGSLPEMVKRMVAVSSVGSLAPATKLFVKNFTS